MYQVKSTITSCIREQVRLFDAGLEGEQAHHVNAMLSLLIPVYRMILESEDPGDVQPKALHFLEDVTSKLRCDYCEADIFTAYFECVSECRTDDGLFVICLTCYLDGRSCVCTCMHVIQDPSYAKYKDMLRHAENALQQLPQALRHDMPAYMSNLKR